MNREWHSVEAPETTYKIAKTMEPAIPVPQPERTIHSHLQDFGVEQFIHSNFYASGETIPSESVGKK